MMKYRNLRNLFSNIKSQIKQKYIDDTNQYRSISIAQRKRQLRGITRIKSQRKLFMGTFPQYPLQYQWLFNKNKYAVYFWQQKQSKTKPKAILLNFHALNAHTGLSAHLAQQLSKENILVGGYDFINFGKSEGEFRGSIDSIQQLIQTSQQFLLHTMTKYPSIPIYISGLSLGGLIAFYVSLRKKKLIQGTILINPAFEDNPYNNKFGKNMMRRFGKHIPKIKLTHSFKNNSSNFSLENYKKTDQFMYSGRVWSSTIYNMLLEMGQSKKKFKQFDLPFLYVQGGSDKLLNIFNAFQFQQKAKSKQKQVVIIHQLWHALWFDQKHFEVIDIIKNWINRRQN